MVVSCAGTNCNKPAGLRCPKCVDLGLRPAFFCSQDCFKKNYSVHKILHKMAKGTFGVTSNNPWPQFTYTGELRPTYPLSLKRVVPDHIPRPDYADDGEGRPFSEIKAKYEEPTKIIPVTDGADLEKLKAVCRLARECLDVGARMIRPGVTTDEIDAAVHAACVERNAYPSPLNYYTFPKSCCTSVNEVICHGIPDHRPLVDGDIVNLDITLYKDGYHGDLNETYFCGNVSDEKRKLVKNAKECLDKAIAMVKPGVAYRDLGNTIHDHAETQGLSVVRSYCGHGINTLFHCAPNVPHYRNNKAVGVMEVGHVFTIEPMINLGGFRDKTWPDNWTSVTTDGKASAQFEHTMIVTETGVEVLTARIDDTLTKDARSQL